MLQTLHGGAAARPFVTHANAFDIDLYLRIAPELFLKRCVVGGIEKVFEINRNFRNEGADSTHSPEFAMLEFYEAYADYDSMATLTRELVQEAALAAAGSLAGRPTTTARVIDLSGEWAQVSMFDGAVATALGQRDHAGHPDRASCAQLADAGRIVATDPTGDARQARRGAVRAPRRSRRSPGRRSSRDFPLDTSPLVRAHRSEPGAGREVGPVRRRLRARHRLLRAGRPGRAARSGWSSRRALAAGGDAEAMRARRGLPARARVRHAAERRAWAWASTGC